MKLGEGRVEGRIRALTGLTAAVFSCCVVPETALSQD